MQGLRRGRIHLSSSVMITLVKQPDGSNLCGAAVVATLLGITLEQAIKRVGKRGLTEASDLRRALKPRIIMGENVRCLDLRLYPERCLCHLKYRDSRNGHWFLCWDGMIMDPAPCHGRWARGLKFGDNRVSHHPRWCPTAYPVSYYPLRKIDRK